MTPRAFLFDPNLCTGCHACALACGIENAPERIDQGGLDWRRIETYNEARLPGIPSFSLSLACNHCGEPACLEACPANAYVKDSETGAVLVEASRCIGCRYCAWACPYDAPRFNPRLGVIEKCTFCRHRLLEGDRPACVAACPTGALEIGEARPGEGGDAPRGVEGDGSAPPPGFRATRLRPAIRFTPLRGKAVQVAQEPPAEGTAPSTPIARSGMSLRGEWSLCAFTGAVPALVAVFAALQWRGDPAPGSGAVAAYAAFALGALLVSTAHLGRPERAWRATVNWRRSWLSREILLAGSFLLLSTAWMAAAWWAGALGAGAGGGGPEAIVPRVLPGVGWALAGLGLFAAFAVDRVYGVILPPGADARRRGFPPIGPVFAGSLYMAALLAGPASLWIPLGLLRLLVTRHSGPRAPLGPGRPWLLVLRLALGFVAAPAWRLVMGDQPAGVAVLVLALAGEAIERGLFYDTLAVTTPRLEMDAALRYAGPRCAPPRDPARKDRNAAA